MNKLKGCYLHTTDNYETPKEIYNYYKDLGYYDPCPLNGKKGLTENWKELNFVNPPYSKAKEFINKAIEELKKGNKSVLLIPARTDTKYFHRLLEETNLEITFIKGRLKFNNLKTCAPFPSLLINLIGIKYE